jgi:hypothetical protein
VLDCLGTLGTCSATVAACDGRLVSAFSPPDHPHDKHGASYKKQAGHDATLQKTSDRFSLHADFIPACAEITLAISVTHYSASSPASNPMKAT